MQPLTSFRSARQARSGRSKAGILATLLFTGVLLGVVQGRSLCDVPPDTIVLLGSSSTGYVNVTPYLVTDQYGVTWVVGYNGEASFAITINAANGQVLDPNGRQIGITQHTE